MNNEDFAIRLYNLRTNKGISARDMSLSLGQNSGYISNIENGKAYPSMSSFIYICDYLGVKPKDFLNYDIAYPSEIEEILSNLKQLSKSNLDMTLSIVKALVIQQNLASGPRED